MYVCVYVCMHLVLQECWSARALKCASSSGSLGNGGEATQKRKLEGHTGDVRSISLSPDDRYLASAGCYGTVRIWEVALGQQVRVLNGHMLPV